ncbi:ArsS family sensor histidine kinase [Malaciobacter marinus]|jgi:two-component system OmpR family sensor kinase|uniref:ArsS family sensor histidine kinase n=1 Tax=Malaciobacter marinus TaxID=505249 RepID=UPI0009A5E133|nr:ArsS family sensor histidine kinase [Malaciobacter marinus]SKB47172.1 two-component system, OmpR family, sensor kinase [Malaciobacter marinus]
MSIFKKISILFFTSLTLMIIIGIWTDNINSKRIDKLIKEKYVKVANNILENYDNKAKIDKILKNHNLKKIKEKPKNSQTLFFKEFTFGHILIAKKSFEDEFIVEINYLDEKYLLKTQDEDNLKDKMILNGLVFLDIFVLVLIFLYLIKLLMPLKNISLEISKFANGDLTRRLNVKSKDEIGQLSIAFNKMASTLEELIKTRQELLKDIGHELRTPIAKGKFAIEKIEDFSKKELLKTIFNDLELLTNELIELEKLNSKELEHSTFNIETLIIQALNKLYIENENLISIDIQENFLIEGDLYYLSMALKNLIDNALKYAISYPIEIKVINKEIHIINSAKQLTKNLEYYFKPFTQELSQRDGFGLGLSIVQKILKKHNFKISYKYKNEKVNFIISLSS